MIEKGLERAASFSWKAVADQHRQMYRRAIGIKKNGAAYTESIEDIHEY